MKEILDNIHHSTYFDKHGIDGSVRKFASIVGIKINDMSDDGIYEFINNNIIGIVDEFTDKDTIALLNDMMCNINATDGSTNKGVKTSYFIDLISNILTHNKYSMIK